VRVVIGEDSALFREGLVRLLGEHGHEVVGAVADAGDLAAAVRECKPDLAVIDVRMPPDLTDDGARAAQALRAEWPALPILMLSQHVETRHLAGLVSSGGFGYLLKDRVLDVSEFLAALTRVAEGGSALDPQVVAALLNRNARRENLTQLTERENDVLRLMAQGITNTGIAKRLVLSERTVEAHVRRLLVKLDIADTEDANRRVLAVLLHLGVRTAPPATEPRSAASGNTTAPPRH
jgi:DNA-binding NarL/FixJ family response regulator